MKRLFIDLETFSSVDLPKCGVYVYAESPDFEILLLSYAFDDEPVRQIDLARGECIPESLIQALTDPMVIKEAFNVNFERTCLSRWLHDALPPEQWRDTMIQAVYLGLPRSLDGVCKALKLSGDEAKMDEGKALITYFCKPCKPTKSNGFKTRRRPGDALDKWETFKRYNIRDVEAERVIARRLEGWPVPEHEWEIWHMDQRINDRGVRIDTDLARKAVDMANAQTDRLGAELQRLTGLENPNSISQLKGWLASRGILTDSLDKEFVAETLPVTDDPTVRRVLEIRKEIGKSSVSKYEAMLRCLSAGDRVRGTLQHYGSHTGRWAGRLLQVQNLPQNHLEDLDAARSTVREGDIDWVQTCYGSVSDTLSQLIRTAIIPGEGKMFAVADFSAIEARLIAWLSGEEWRQKVFADGGDIYCMSASQMFHVPVEKHGVNAHLRQKGKIAELACIAEGQKVLTDRGLIPIESVTKDDRLWDGIEWVSHDGVVCKGEKEVLTYEGIQATADHLVWAEVCGEPRPLRLGDAASRGAHLAKTGAGGQALRLGGNYQPGEALERKVERLLRSDEMHGVRVDSMATLSKPSDRKVERVSGLHTAACNSKVARQTLRCGKTEMHEPERRQLQELRSARDTVSLQIGAGRGAVHDRDERSAIQRDGDRPDRRERTLRAGESQMGDASAKLSESAPVRKRVYDILNAGPRHRFTVSDVLVHNCGYQGGVGALTAMGALKMGLTEEELPDIVTKWRAASPHIVDLWRRVGEAAFQAAVYHEESEDIGYGITYRWEAGTLKCRLPSGRDICYPMPRATEGKWGQPGISFMGTGWKREETFGGRLVENLIQAIGRDCLAEAMLKVSERYNIVMHVHDEMIVEVQKTEADSALGYMQKCMAEAPAWAPGLILRGDGYTCKYYMKD